NAVGQPLESIARRVVPRKVADVGNAALRKTMELAVGTGWATGAARAGLQKAYETSSWTSFWHTLATVATGFGGGLFGLPGPAVELPLTTGIMFRSIASIADNFGEDLMDPACRLECLSVFSYGGLGPEDDAMESTYLTVRVGMAKLIQDAARFLAHE